MKEISCHSFSKHVAWSTIVAGAWALSFALYFEIFQDYEACHLCLLQRIPYIIMIIIGALGVLRPQFILFCITLTLVTTVASTLLALYHVGVEQNLWDSISACKSTAIGHISVEELKKSLLERPALSCANIEWSVFGISMAGYNSLYSLFLAFMSVLVLRKLKEENIG